MKLIIDPDAAELIRQKGGHAIVFAGKTGGCCTFGWILEPQVEIGRPRRPLEAYRVIEADGATIYLDRTLDWVEKTYRLHVTRFLGFKALSVSYEGG
ncbi:MAG: CC/Se motif family (seleno)protein [Bacillota bacterium]